MPMTDLPTLEDALKLADQDCPLPSLAGPALKRLRLEYVAEREECISLAERAQVSVQLLRHHCCRAGINPVGQDYNIALSERIDHLLAIESAVAPLRFGPKVTDSATLTALIAELRARDGVGRAKYGTDVDRADLTNGQWRQHLREELMDALLYSLAEERTQPMEVVDCGGCAPAVQASPQRSIEDMQWSFQEQVHMWMLKCFGKEIAADGIERNHRFLEESIELVQACGCTASEAHQLVDYVFGRPIGEKAQEVGGVMVTLAALCQAQTIDMKRAGDTELTRIWTKVEQIRAKQAAKPKHSPLPGPTPVYGIDQGNDDKTVEAFGHTTAAGGIQFTDFVESKPNSPNSGHGHVRPRPDGVKARCGGPALCRVCWNEQRNIERTQMLDALLPPVPPNAMVKVECDESGINVTVIPESEIHVVCWCETCNPRSFLNSHMVLCPTCGNKRCPHAHYHRNACTGSNDVGQPGSSWEHVKPLTKPADKDC
jgi:hypothetical protein